VKVKKTFLPRGVAGTSALLLLIAVAVAGDVGIPLAATMVGSAFVCVVFFQRLFPGSAFFSLALANSIAAYVSVFVFLSDSNFRGVSTTIQHAGFLLPLVSFVAGAYARRESIRVIVTQQRVRSAADFRRSSSWLVPTAILSGLTFLLPGLDPSDRMVDWTFLAAMTAMSLFVIAATQQVAIFLIDAGLLFEEFFARLERLILPVYAFLTFYSLIVVAFAAIYKIVDRFVPGPHFKMLGENARVSFSDAIYFSVVTLSTVGYGDVLPVSEPIRLIALVEVVFGITLLLVGFSEIMSYSREIQARSGEGKGGEK
jgi:voltage-gated potassium channel